MTDRIASGVTLTRLDLASKKAETDAFIKQAKGEEYTARYGYAYAVAEVDGVLYALCTEGVGQPVTEDEPLVIDVYAEKPGRMAIMPVAQMTLTPAEVREIATGEQVRLEDFVRSFGARLEANYSLWANRLNPTRNAAQSLS